MLSRNTAIRPQGFSLIELLIGIAIMGILLAVALPSFRAWMVNSQIRNAAESIQNGLQHARAEALARNTSVTFGLHAAVGSDQTSWDVFETNSMVNIETRLSSEGSTNVQRTVFPAGATTVVFDNTGRPSGANDITSIALNSTAVSEGETQELTVMINFGGSTKMCDPNVSGTNPRACN